MHPHTLTHPRARTLNTHPNTNTCTHPNTHAQAHTCTRIHARTQTRTYVSTNTHTHTRTHPNTHVRTHTHTHTHTRTCIFMQMKKGDVHKALMMCIECADNGLSASEVHKSKRKRADAVEKGKASGVCLRVRLSAFVCHMCVCVCVCLRFYVTCVGDRKSVV